MTEAREKQGLIVRKHRKGGPILSGISHARPRRGHRDSLLAAKGRPTWRCGGRRKAFVQR